MFGSQPRLNFLHHVDPAREILHADRVQRRSHPRTVLVPVIQRRCSTGVVGESYYQPISPLPQPRVGLNCRVQILLPRVLGPASGCPTLEFSERSPLLSRLVTTYLAWVGCPQGGCTTRRPSVISPEHSPQLTTQARLPPPFVNGTLSQRSAGVLVLARTVAGPQGMPAP